MYNPLQEEVSNDEDGKDGRGMVGDGVEEELALLPHDHHQVVQNVCFHLLVFYLLFVFTLYRSLRLFSLFRLCCLYLLAKYVVKVHTVHTSQ